MVFKNLCILVQLSIFVSSNVDCDPVLLTLQDEDLLEGLCVLRRISHGTVLTKQGEQDASMVFVVTGTLQVLQQVVGHEDESVSINNPLMLLATNLVNVK